MNEMKKVYVAGKYSADNVLDVLKNIGIGRKTCAELFAMGFAPFCPWHDAAYVIDNPNFTHDKKAFYEASLLWMECCDAVYVISGKGEGTGVDAEIERAEELGIPVFESLMKLLSWKDAEDESVVTITVNV